jgi:hypothetical protein
MTTTPMSREQSVSYCSQEDLSLLSKGWKANKMSFGMPTGVVFSDKVAWAKLGKHSKANSATIRDSAFLQRNLNGVWEGLGT